jgi:hypothetical protein
MTTMGKTIFVALGLAVLIAGTLLLRTAPEPAALGQLTPAQMAELKPAPLKPADPPKKPEVAPDAGDKQSTDLDVEDGSGS